MSNAIRSLEEKVRAVLSTNPDARNSDELLAWKVWEGFYGIVGTITLTQFIQLPSQAAIARVRARIQNGLKLYLPTSWAVAQHRQWNEVEWRSYCATVNSAVAAGGLK